jgi:NADH:ubiquinone reductase (H+-translocating)
MSKPRVVILGAGFGGLACARKLKNHADVLVIDKHNYQTFLPLLYQVSTAGLAADHVAYPIRGILRKAGAQFRMGSPISIDHKNSEVKLDSSEVFKFDHLVLALGSVTTDFGISGVMEHALGMKNIQEALNIRGEVMRRFEDLCRFNEATEFHISVVGGGPTGVEMAGALAELVKGPLHSDEPEAAKHISVTLIEAGPRILPMFSEKISKRAKSDLEKLGVSVLLNSAVKEVKPRSIELKSGKKLNSEVTIWAAGVKANPVMKQLSIPEERGRVSVNQTLQVKNYPKIWAIGDMSGGKNKDGNLLPMVAPVAIQQGKFVAEQIINSQKGKPLSEFSYRDKGSMATIGRHKAAVQVGKLQYTGFTAWLSWLFLHLLYLLGGRNKIGTLADWMWNYFTFDRSNRHIMDA